MSAYSDWDTSNVLAEHVIEYLKLDDELKASGSLEVPTNGWSEHFAEEASDVRDDYVPRIACEVLAPPSTEIVEAGRIEKSYDCALEIIVAHGDRDLRHALLRRYSDRCTRALLTQSIPTGLSNVAADLEDADPTIVIDILGGTPYDDEKFDQQQRGVVAVAFTVTISFNV